LIIGNPEPFHVGAHFFKASNSLGFDTKILDTNEAFSGSRLIQSALWRFWGHLPQRLGSFGNRVVMECKNGGFSTVLATGISPLNKDTLEKLKKFGVCTINYLTDDPWNVAHRAPWFLEAIGYYHSVATTKSSNIVDLKKSGCKNVEFIPFGYDSNCHQFAPVEISYNNESDIIFVGGADSDRTAIMQKIVNNNFSIELYGGYWNKKDCFKQFSRGNADLLTLAKRGQCSKISLCLVRRANRDGHVMRSFEIAASGGCMLVEDTGEHREIFGPDGECVVYFSNDDQMISRARWLVQHDLERLRLRKAVYKKIVLEGNNTYADRLKQIFAMSGSVI